MATFALAASVEARLYTGNLFGFTLKAHKNKFKIVDVADIRLNCDEGQTDMGNSNATATRWRWNSPPYPSVKRDRRFHIVEPKAQSFPVIDANGNLVGVEKDEYVLRAKGRFNRSFSKAFGTVRITGSFRGPDPNGPEGYMIQYHHCDSGALNWKAHKRDF